MNHFYQNIPGWFSYRAIYEQAVKEAQNLSTFVEVGCWKGRSSAFLLVEIINSKKTISLGCVDTWLGSDEVKHQTDADVRAHRLFDVFWNNIAPARESFDIPGRKFWAIGKKSTEAASLFADSSLDFVMIDAAHDYDSVMCDLDAWWGKIKPAGVIAGDDFHFRGVNAAVEDFFGKDKVERIPGTGTGVGWRMRK